MASLVDRYDAAYPDVAIPDAQKEERQMRADFKTEVRTHSRTGRNRGIVIPSGAWERIFGDGNKEKKQ